MQFALLVGHERFEDAVAVAGATKAFNEPEQSIAYHDDVSCGRTPRNMSSATRQAARTRKA